MTMVVPPPPPPNCCSLGGTGGGKPFFRVLRFCLRYFDLPRGWGVGTGCQDRPIKRVGCRGSTDRLNVCFLFSLPYFLKLLLLWLLWWLLFLLPFPSLPG